MTAEVAPIVAVAVAAIGAVIDLRTRRIPNLLTFGGAAAALAFHTSTSGLHGLAHSSGGWAVGVALFLPMFLLRGLGAGDVKLLGAVGAWLGPLSALRAGLYSVLAGGALALAVGLRHKYLAQAFRNLWGLFAFWRAAGIHPQPGLTIDESPGPRLAYGLAIALGTAVTVWVN